MSRRAAACLLLLTLGGLLPLRAETTAKTPLDILQRVAKNYDNVQSFLFQGTANSQVIVDGNPQQLVTANVLLAGIQPDKVRFELQSPRGNIMLVRNGKKEWRFPEGNGPQFLAAVRGSESGFSGGDTLATAAYVLMHRYRTLPERAQEARLVREDVLEAAGQRIRCYVIDLPLAGSNTEPAEEYWIDAGRFIVLKSVVNSLAKANNGGNGLKTTLLLKSVRFNEPVDAKLFAFETAKKAPPKAPASTAPRDGTDNAPRPAPSKSTTKRLKQVVVQ